MIRTLALVLAFLPGTALAQDIVYDFRYTQACLDGTDLWHERVDCIGTSANRCMDETEGGYSTYGESACLSAEADDWDRWLNQIYPAFMDRMRNEDRIEGERMVPITRADALRDMQRAWIPYRDASCAFERSKWGGGTGAGPAGVSCRLYMTGEQVLRFLGEVGMH